ncbi:MAG: excinuclease ABC subunit UvrC [Flavobacteriaceae bacterium]|nr:excinuclease ABC subunit C [Flavobacteriaceae bacterium]MDG1830808.1 excinuclease ABC subunit UvrC [Flavobacteriaceae bacterium]
MNKKSFELKLATIPTLPGVYQFFNDSNKIIYIGKAKNLKNRVSSYFQKTFPSQKTKALVQNIYDIKHVVVSSESDALLLENSLIKKFQPKYNILLRDDKTYPWICIKKERFPRIFFTRKLIKDGSEYYGPYTNYKTINILLDLINNLYPIRISNYNLSEKQINSNKEELSLRMLKKAGNIIILGFHIGDYSNSNEHFISEKDYSSNIYSVKQILKGKFAPSKKLLKKQMHRYSKKMDFENAQKIKEKIALLDNYQSKSTVVSSKLNNIDVFSILSDQTHAYINYLQVAYGRIVRFHNVEIKKKLDESDKDLLLLCIIDLRKKLKSNNKTIICPFDFSKLISAKFILPKAGDNKKLLELSKKNVALFKIEKLKKIQIVDPERHAKRILDQMKNDLRLKTAPIHIECFDNSNIQGSNPVAACVVFINGKPAKKEYRRYNIKTIKGPDDYASMEEVVYRRYQRVIKEKKSLPNLIILDGGKGQLNSGMSALKKLNLNNKITVLGIAKRLEEIYSLQDPIPLYLDKRSESLKLIQHMRNEAHRFAITFHRNKRSNKALRSSIDLIPGIGEKTKITLLKKYKSLKKIKETPEELIAKDVGVSKAKKLMSFLNSSS